MSTLLIDPAIPGTGDAARTLRRPHRALRNRMRRPSGWSRTCPRDARGEISQGAIRARRNTNMRVEDFAQVLIALKPSFIHHQDSWSGIAAMLIVTRIRSGADVSRRSAACGSQPRTDISRRVWRMPIIRIGICGGPRRCSKSTGGCRCMTIRRRAGWRSIRATGSSRPSTTRRCSVMRAGTPINARTPLSTSPRIRAGSRTRSKTSNSNRKYGSCAGPGGSIIFSGAHLHSTVANTSRPARASASISGPSISTIVIAGRGAPNVDSRPAGTSLRDFKRLSDGQRVPDEVAAEV